MAKTATRQISLFINDKQVTNSLKAIQAEQRLLTNEIRNTVIGSAEYEKKVGELKKVNTILADHRQKLSGLEAGWRQTKVGLDKFVGVAAGAFAADQLLGYGKQLFNTASQMDALSKKAKTVFGEALPLVTQEAERNARAMGLTNAQYINATAAIQDLLIPMGFQRKQAAEISSQLVNLSGALSEWTGGQIKAEEVSKILSKALLGEREELKQLGISISDADVKANLAAKGLDKLTGSALEQAKAASTLEIILAKSTDAQAQFADGAGSMVRRQAEVTAKFNEIIERLSKALIPVFENLVSLASGVADALDFIFTGANQAAKAQETLVTATQKTQAAFNAEIEVLTEGNFTQAERGKLIAEINARYGEYLPNLISEKASIDEIRAAQEAANKVFAQKILFLAFQEKLTEVTKEGARATNEAFESEKRRQQLLQKGVKDFQDNAGLEELNKSQIALSASLRENALQIVKDTPKQVAQIKKVYGALADELGTTLDELTKKFGTVTDGKNKASNAAESKAKIKDKEAEEQRLFEISQAGANALSGLRALQKEEVDRLRRENLQKEKDALNQNIDQYLSFRGKQRLIDEDYFEGKKNAQEKIDEYTETSLQKQVELAAAQYEILLELAEKYGLDTLELKEKFAEEEKTILEQITGGPKTGTFKDLNNQEEAKIKQLQKYYEAKRELAKGNAEEIAKVEKEYAALTLEIETEFNAKRLQLFQSAFQGIAQSLTEAFSLFSDSESDFVAFQKALSIVQIAIDTATAISGIVAAAASTSLTPLDLALKIGAGTAIVLANIAKAKKLLDTKVPVRQKYEGGFLDVTGEQDGRNYRARMIAPPSTGFLPDTPVLFTSNATQAPVLASERGREYFVSADSLRNPYVANLVHMIDLASGRRVPQFADGGTNTTAAPAPAPVDNTLQVKMNQNLERMNQLLLMLLQQGVEARIGDGTVLDINDRFKTLQKVSGNYF